MIEQHYEISPKITYRPIEQLKLKSEGVKKVGIGLIIVDLNTKKIWSIVEKGKKSSTQRKIDETSIPMETRKTNETIMQNAIGGLSEFRELQEGEELVWLDGGYSYKGRYPFVDGVVADVILIGLRNKRPETYLKLKNKEVDPKGWMDINELINEPKLRNGVGRFLQLAKNENWIDTFIEKVKSNQGNQRIVRKGDSILEYKEARGTKKDVKLP